MSKRSIIDRYNVTWIFNPAEKISKTIPDCGCHLATPTFESLIEKLIHAGRLTSNKKQSYYQDSCGFSTNDENWNEGLSLLWDLERK